MKSTFIRFIMLKLFDRIILRLKLFLIIKALFVINEKKTNYKILIL